MKQYNFSICCFCIYFLALENHFFFKCCVFELARFSMQSLRFTQFSKQISLLTLFIEFCTAFFPRSVMESMASTRQCVYGLYDAYSHLVLLLQAWKFICQRWVFYLFSCMQLLQTSKDDGVCRNGSDWMHLLLEILVNLAPAFKSLNRFDPFLEARNLVCHTFTPLESRCVGVP